MGKENSRLGAATNNHDCRREYIATAIVILIAACIVIVAIGVCAIRPTAVYAVIV